MKKLLSLLLLLSLIVTSCTKDDYKSYRKTVLVTLENTVSTLNLEDQGNFANVEIILSGDTLFSETLTNFSVSKSPTIWKKFVTLSYLDVLEINVTNEFTTNPIIVDLSGNAEFLTVVTKEKDLNLTCEFINYKHVNIVHN